MHIHQQALKDWLLLAYFLLARLSPLTRHFGAYLHGKQPGHRKNCSRDIIPLTVTDYNMIGGKDLLVPGACVAYFLTCENNCLGWNGFEIQSSKPFSINRSSIFPSINEAVNATTGI